MPKLTMWILPFVVIAAVVGGVFAGKDFGFAPKQEFASTQSSENTVWSHGHDGANANAEGHWEKHGREFPEFHSAQDYERGAQTFIATPPQGTLTKRRTNGDTLFYNPATNTFAVADRRGEPRTFFRPNNGRAYWDRQQ
jgi:filamentous hemagglutinin